MFALASMKLATQCCCCPMTGFSRHAAATGQRLMSDNLVTATPSLHIITNWSFSHKSCFLLHSSDKIVYLMHQATELLATAALAVVTKKLYGNDLMYGSLFLEPANS